MPRYELVEGTAKKFWDITLAGRSVTVAFGRIGSAGQSKTTSFPSTREAKARHDELVAEKVAKGYRPVATPAPRPAGKRAGGGVAATCDAIERYFADLRAAGVDLDDERLRPQSAAAIANIEKKLATPLPPDVAAFLTRGLRGATGAIEDGARFAAVGFEWLDARGIVEATQALRDAADDLGDDDPHAAVARRGIALTFEEPQIVVADAVYHFSYRNPLTRVVADFEAFLAAWLDAGCFASHDFELLWAQAQPLLAGVGPPSRNPWVKAHEKHRR